MDGRAKEERDFRISFFYSAYISRASAVYPTDEIMKKERIVLQNRDVETMVSQKGAYKCY